MYCVVGTTVEEISRYDFDSVLGFLFSYLVHLYHCVCSQHRNTSLYL